MRKYAYPRIAQIIPAENIWIKYKDEVKREYFYSKANCLAIIEEIDDDVEEIHTSIMYLDMDDDGFCESTDCHQYQIKYSTTDLSKVTEPFEDSMTIKGKHFKIE